jgi:hypothetical protein
VGVEVELYSFFNLGARWGGWSTPRPGRFTLGKEVRYPLYRRLGGPQGRSGRVRKISPPPGFDPQTVQPIASHYAIPAQNECRLLYSKMFDFNKSHYLKLLTLGTGNQKYEVIFSPKTCN